MKIFKKIGVLGGMGPYATAYFYKCLLDESHRQLDAVQDGEYPQIIINSLSLQGSSEKGIIYLKQILDQLTRGIRSLTDAGVDFITIPCNSSHSMLNVFKKETNVPILNIIDVTITNIIKDKSKKILLLASEEAYQNQLWDTEKTKNIKIYEPKHSEKRTTTNLIFNVMGGTVSQYDKQSVVKIIERMKKSYCIDSVILGCTELPLAITKDDISVKLYDSSRLLAKRAIEIYKKNVL